MSDRDLRIRVILDAMNKASGPLNAIRESSRKAGAAIRDTRADLVRLEKAQADIKGFRDLKRGLGETETKLDSARQRTAALARQIEQADSPTRKLTSDFAKAKREAADLGRTFDAQQRELQETRDRLQAVGVSTNSLVAGERRLASEVRQANARLAEQKRHYADLQRSAPRRMDHARASAQADRDSARDDLRRMQTLERMRSDRAERWNSAARYGTGIVGTAVAAAATATGVDAVVEDAQYEHMLTSIGQKADLTRTQAQRLGDTLRRIAPDVARLPGDMAEGADTLAGIGLLSKFDAIKDPEQRFRALDRAVAQIMRASGRAATAYDAEQDDMVRSVAAGVQNLQIPAEKAQRILDIMAAGDNSGAFSMKAMAAELPGLTGAWGALGQVGDKALGQLVAGLETTRMLAGDDAEAANNLKNLILKLNSKELATNFGKFGVNLPVALKKAKAEGRDLLEVIAELTNKATKGDNDKIAQIFTDQQAQMAVVALITKMKEYRGLRDSVLQADGLVDKQFDERMNDKIAKTARLKAEWSNLEIEIGKSLSPLTDSAIDGATGWMATFSANIRARGLGGAVNGLLGGGMIPVEVIKQREAELARMKAERESLRKQGWPAASPSTLNRPQPLPAARIPAPPPSFARPKPAAAAPALGNLKQVGQAWAVELNRQNTTARQFQNQALNDQRGAAARSLGEAGRFKVQMRTTIGNSGEYSSLGRNMMAGLQSGMQGYLPGLLATMTSIGARIRAAFRSDMQIKSPSRVFATYGGYLTQGLAQGIEGGADAPLGSIRRLSRRVVAEAPALQAPPPITFHGPGRGTAGAQGAGAPPASYTFNITMNVQQQPGEDGAALAQRMMGEFNSMARSAAARRASSYEDLD